MTRALRVGFIVQALALAVLLTTALDVYAHKRVEQLGGVNIWGYRGPTLRLKRANEVRVALVGGTMAFGWGVAAEESMISTVRRLVSLAFDRPGGAATYVTGVNVALTGVPHGEYDERLRKYANLEFDIVCVYPDPVDLASTHTLVPRESAIEALTGYTPILPVVLDEKGVPFVGNAWRAADRSAFTALRRSSQPVNGVDATIAAIEQALTQSRGVVVILPIARRASEGVPGLAARLAHDFGSDARVRVVDAAADERLHDPSLRLDGESFGAGGNALVGEIVSPAVIELLRAARTQS